MCLWRLAFGSHSLNTSTKSPWLAALRTGAIRGGGRLRGRDCMWRRLFSPSQWPLETSKNWLITTYCLPTIQFSQMRVWSILRRTTGERRAVRPAWEEYQALVPVQLQAIISVERCSEPHIHLRRQPSHTELNATCDVRMRSMEQLETENAALLDG